VGGNKNVGVALLPVILMTPIGYTYDDDDDDGGGGGAGDDAVLSGDGVR